MPIPVKPLRSVEEQRLYAAEASRGISSDVIYDRIIDILQKQDLSGRVLDYGAGVGNLTRRLWDLRRFQAISGADIQSRPQDLPEEISWYCLDLNDAGVIPGSSFEMVIAAEIIEHLENPRAVARECYRILKPGGTLILSTPNNESLRSLLALLVRGHFIAFDDTCYPAHITALLRKDLTRILRESGFSDVRFEFTDSGGLPKMPAVTWQQVSFGLLKGCRFSDTLIAVAVK